MLSLNAPCPVIRWWAHSQLAPLVKQVSFNRVPSSLPNIRADPWAKRHFVHHLHLHLWFHPPSLHPTIQLRHLQPQQTVKLVWVICHSDDCHHSFSIKKIWVCWYISYGFFYQFVYTFLFSSTKEFKSLLGKKCSFYSSFPKLPYKKISFPIPNSCC